MVRSRASLTATSSPPARRSLEDRIHDLSTIYHNPACGKSRNTLEMIRQSGEVPQVIEYLKDPPSRARLVELIHAMGIRPRDSCV